jgi:hypothetical protein
MAVNLLDLFSCKKAIETTTYVIFYAHILMVICWLKYCLNCWLDCWFQCPFLSSIFPHSGTCRSDSSLHVAMTTSSQLITFLPPPALLGELRHWPLPA